MGSVDEATPCLHTLESTLSTGDKQIEALEKRAQQKALKSQLLQRWFQKRRDVDTNLRELRQAAAEQWERFKPSVGVAAVRTAPRVQGKVLKGTTLPPPRRDEEATREHGGAQDDVSRGLPLRHGEQPQDLLDVPREGRVGVQGVEAAQARCKAPGFPRPPICEGA